MLTYYVTVKVGDHTARVYIIDFFKRVELFKDMELWESILIESIYSEKKATIQLLISSSCISSRHELAEA
jgi:hypothetical protein